MVQTDPCRRLTPTPLAFPWPRIVAITTTRPPGIDDPLDVHPEISDCVVEPFGDRGEGVDARSSSRFKGIAWVDPLDIGVQQGRLRGGGSGRPTRVDAAHDLHVLLRHLPAEYPAGEARHSSERSLSISGTAVGPLAPVLLGGSC